MSDGPESRYNPEAPPFTPDWPVKVDLHLHTTASDGTLSPAQLIDLVAEAGLRIVAVTDHDTTDGIPEAMEAAERHQDLTLITGIEFGAEIGESEVHLIGLFVDFTNADLQASLRRFREERVDAARGTVEKLGTLGVNISWDRVRELAGGTVGRPHIARALLEAGYVRNVPEAFDRYLGSDGPARVPRPKFPPVEALNIIHAAGGVGIVAHPRTVKHLGDVLTPLVDGGLAGIEVYAEKYGREQQDEYRALAQKYDLVESGGTDYHAFGNENEVMPGKSGPPPATAQMLFERGRLLHGDRVGFVPTRPLQV